VNEERVLSVALRPTSTRGTGEQVVAVGVLFGSYLEKGTLLRFHVAGRSKPSSTFPYRSKLLLGACGDGPTSNASRGRVTHDPMQAHVVVKREAAPRRSTSPTERRFRDYPMTDSTIGPMISRLSRLSANPQEHQSYEIGRGTPPAVQANSESHAGVTSEVAPFSWSV
jgi:hypothetical protein